MSTGSQRHSGNGIGLGTILFVVFLVLKLTHFIDWSWWWVFAPLWLPLAALGVFLTVAFLIWSARGGRL